MEWILPIVLVLAGILGASGFIIAKKPSAASLIAKLTPYQAFFGVFLLAWGLYWLIHLGPGNLFKSVDHLFGLTWLGAIVTAILLGFFFGMPQIAKWIPGESNAEQKAVALSKKLAPFQIILGLAGIGFGLLALLFNLKILKP
ncbi:MAG: hypothetical protein KIT31_25625 [Deltaproteobacteria bacterium]|nr:hypothetical protein [Deltaproteobacteria bacterium]